MLLVRNDSIPQVLTIWYHVIYDRYTSFGLQYEFKKNAAEYSNDSNDKY